MSIEKMTLVQITGNIKYFDRILRRCSASGIFHPELMPQPTDKLGGFAHMEEENPYKSILNSLVDAAAASGIELKYDPEGGKTVEQDTVDSFLADYRKRVVELNEKKVSLQTAIEQNEAALTQLVHLDALDVSLDDIFACKYIKVRFGRLPTDSYKKLEYYRERLFLFLSISGDDDYQWGVYFTTNENQAEIDDIFSSLYFERIHIPEYVHGKPGLAKVNIEGELASTRAQLKAAEAELNALVSSNKQTFQKVYSRIRFLNEAFDLRKYVTVYNEMFDSVDFRPARITGFIAHRDEKNFARLFDDLDGVVVEMKPPDSDKRLTIPTKLRNNWFVKPFEMFVDMYGTPAYNELDPTPFLAVTYTLLFGIMFGDLGQGIVISLLGLFLWKVKKMNFGRVLSRIGVSAAAFGVLYGSVFGMEHALDSFYTKVLGLAGKPIEVMRPTTINNLLIFAVSLGVVLIISSMLINIFLGFKNKDYEKAVFGNNGIAGLVFYVSVLVGAISMLAGKSLFTPAYVMWLIILPILVIFLKTPLAKLAKGSHSIKPEDGIGSFILEGFFELFEVVLSFVTNTMSFLRVGGFIISHAGMMAVVMTLTEMMTGAGSVVVMIIGNLFVMALEGFIVGIQALRLEFYEMFSHYFDGQGKVFTPVTIGNK
ncbi:MAG: V-type ATPase 116kDa subunit family protein [Hydrogenoanaerobacterium sp.]